MTSLIDTHCHLDMLKCDVATAIERTQAANVEKIITISVDIPSLDFVRQAVQQWPYVYGSLGIHPHDAKTYTDEVTDLLLDIVPHSSKIVAIGETGLDYYYLHSDRDIQKTVFRQQLQLAESLQRPVILHSRDAEKDTLSILEQNPVTRKGVAHSFTGSLAMANTLIEMGWYIGINGIVTFRTAEELREVVRQLPLDRILLETDAPFLSPVPFRGKPNDPSKVLEIAKFLANMLQIPLEQMARQTTENAQRLFQLEN